MKKRLSIAFALTLIVALFIIRSDQPPTRFAPEENPGYTYSVEHTSLNVKEVRAREATIKIFSPSGGHGSGTLYIRKGKFIVLTAGHVVEKKGLYLLVDTWGEERIGRVIYTDPDHDFAVIATTKFTKAKPIRLRVPSYDIKKDVDSGLVFSGYPSELPLLTVRGSVAGFREDALIMHSAAWMGSSGSNVFDNFGNFIGVLFGVSVGRFVGIPVLMEDMIWITPYYLLDWDAINEAIKERG